MSLVVYDEYTNYECATEEDTKIFLNNSEFDETSSMPTTSSNITSTCHHEPRLKLLDGKFFQYLPEISTANNIVALCMKCYPKRTQVKGYNNCSSNFLSHLKRKHGDECVEEYKNYIKTKRVEKQCITTDDNTSSTTAGMKIQIVAGTSMKKRMKTLTQEQFDTNIVKFFINSLIPLRTCENSYFMKMFLDLNVSDMNFNLITEQILRQNIQECYTRQIQEITRKLHDTQHVCMTIDTWLGVKNTYVSVQAHWITEDLCRTSIALACRGFPKTQHHPHRISELVQKIYYEFDVTNKIAATITDRRTNFRQAFKKFGIQLTLNVDNVDNIEDDEEDVMENCSLPAYLQNCAHALSLCATRDAQLSTMHMAVMKKCNALWQTVGSPGSGTLNCPDETRWNSLFECLQQIVAMKDALNIKNRFLDNDYEYLQEYLACSAPITEALDILHDQNNSYYGIVAPCLFTLRRKLKKIEKKQHFRYCQSLIETFIESIERRFGEFYDLTTTESQNAAIAALSFPRFKNKWLACVQPTQRNKILSLFKTIVSKEINENAEIVESPKSVAIIKQNDFFNFDSDSDSENSSELDTPLNVKAKQLVQNFFADERQGLDVLNHHEEIKNVFIKYNTVLPSFALVQNVFAGTVMSNLPLNYERVDQMFEQRLILRTNLNYEGFN